MSQKETNKTTTPSFEGHEKAYFEWSRQEPPPPVWEEVEKPALQSGLDFATKGLERSQIQQIKALDVGLGAGKVIGLLKELQIPSSNIVALDINPEMISLAQGVLPDVDMRQLDISKPSVIDGLSDKGPFDVITASLVLNHLKDLQFESALPNIFNLLKDGGHFVGLVPSPNNPYKSKLLIESETGYWYEDYAPWGGRVVCRHRSFREYHEYFELSGFITYITHHNFEKFTNRLLIVAQKNIKFQEFQKGMGIGIESIVRQKYFQDS